MTTREEAQRLFRESRAALAALRDRAPASPAGEQTLEVPVAIEPFLFAGGAAPRHNDRVSLVRPASVLGQLRFFWRLVTTHANTADMFAAEARVFGAATKTVNGAQVSRSAPFRLSVRVDDVGTLDRVPERIGDPGAYVMFSGRAEARTNTPAAQLRRGVTATLVFRGRLDPTLLQAIRAWTLFGGVGARTRRGLGAVQAPFPPGNALATLDALIRTFPTATGPRCGGRVRGIASVWRTGQTFPTAKDCLYALEAWYKAYRQDRRPGNPPGRSFWDEPELIRQVTGQREPRHPPLPVPQGKHAPGWARAVLGLPIVFSFHPKDKLDPRRTTLQGARRKVERMASPLLFRAVRLAPDTYVGVVVQLTGPYEPPGGLGLKGGPTTPVALTTNVAAVFHDLFKAGVAAPRLRLTQVA